MNKVDLRARVTVATSGWLAYPPRGTRASQAALAHRRLLTALAGAPARESESGKVRRHLMSEINAVALTLTAAAMSCLGDLRQSRCEFTFKARDMTGATFIERFEFEDVPPVSDAWAVLSLVESMRRVPARDQLRLMKIFRLRADWAADEVDLHLAQREGDTLAIERFQRDLDSCKEQIEAVKRRIGPHARTWLEDERNSILSLTWFTWALPVEIAPAATDVEILEAAGWYEQLAKAMYRPLPVDCAAAEPNASIWAAAWESYEDCGSAFAVLAAWLRCMVHSDEFRRCELCYRHCGPGMKRFCATHTRTAAIRQDVRDLHISPLYKLCSRAHLRSTPGLRKLLDADAGRTADLAQMTDTAKRLGIAAVLVQPAATLAAQLRQLWPVLHPSLQDDIKEHFEHLLSVARRPFEQPNAHVSSAARENLRQRALASRWLGWESFFRTWYGGIIKLDWSSDAFVGKALDVAHPIAQRQSVTPSKIALDLAYLRSWTFVDKTFNGYAYLDPLRVVNMLRQDDQAGRPRRSLAEIGAVLGASAEAVRETLQYADGAAVSPDRRYRVLPEGIRRLRQLFT